MNTETTRCKKSKHMKEEYLLYWQIFKKCQSTAILIMENYLNHINVSACGKTDKEAVT